MNAGHEMCSMEIPLELWSLLSLPLVSVISVDVFTSQFMLFNGSCFYFILITNAMNNEEPTMAITMTNGFTYNKIIQIDVCDERK